MIVQKFNKMLTTLDKIGLVCISIVGFQISKCLLKLFYKILISPQIGRLNVNKLKDMGKYALVTGATDGLGKAYAEYLASLGINIILVSRTEEKLKTVANEIENKYHVETKIIVADFINGENIYQHIEKQCTGLEIGILVNNVGMSYPHPEYFLAVKKESEMFDNLLKCNIVSVIKMCEIILPSMVERKKGVIINISSAAALLPNPLLTVYAATKAFVNKFSVDLGTEYGRQGIIVQSVLPGFVATKMSKIRTSTWMAPSPKQYVSQAMKTIGVEESTAGYLPHTLLITLVTTIESISPKLARWFVLRTMQNLRARALRRYIN